MLLQFFQTLWYLRYQRRDLRDTYEPNQSPPTNPVSEVLRVLRIQLLLCLLQVTSNYLVIDFESHQKQLSCHIIARPDYQDKVIASLF